MNEQANNEKTIDEKLVVTPDAEEISAEEQARTDDQSTPAADAAASETKAQSESVPNQEASGSPETVAEASTESPAETRTETQKRKTNPFLVMLCFIWLPLSFIFPFAVTHHQASQTYFELPSRTRFTEAPDRKIEDTRNESIRSGLVGMIAALAIFAIWQLDKLNRKEKGAVDLRDKKVAVIMMCLAGLLWLVWTASGHIMLRVNDEVYDIPPQLPGLETDE